MVVCSKNCLWTTYIWFCRFYALIIALALWGLGAEIVTYFSVADGILILIAALVVTLLEAVFAVRAILPLCPCNGRVGVWTLAGRGVLWVDVWRKGVLYCVLSIPCFPAARGYMTIWAYLAGVGLCLLGVMYSVHTIRKSALKASPTREIDNRTYNRFDDVADIDELEDSIVNPVSVGIMTMADQSEILDV